MNVELACIPCIMKQAYNTAIRATEDTDAIQKILNMTAEYVQRLDYSMTPADASNYVYAITREITGNPDPYKKEKDMYNTICIKKIPQMRKIIAESDDPLRAAVKISIFGNLIDLGIGLKFDLDKDLDTFMNKKFPADDYSQLKDIIEGEKKNIMFLGDNAGEIVFDTLLAEMISKKHDVVYVVKSGPIINDATLEDARYVGMTSIVRVIETGSNGIGVKWSDISIEFQEYYKNADVILSKGQGNFETMSGKRGDKFFLLRAKCDSVARELGVSFADIVLQRETVG